VIKQSAIFLDIISERC